MLGIHPYTQPGTSPTRGWSVLPVFLMALVIVTIGETTSAAERVSVEVGTDAVSRYNWRGLDFGDALSIQPYLRCEYQGLKGGFWGSYSSDFEEIDTWISYTVSSEHSLSVTGIVTGYYFPTAGIRLFNFHGADHPDGPGAHLLEAGVSVSGPARIPLTVSGYVNVHNDPGNNTYVQLDYAATQGATALAFSIGAALGSTKNPAAYGTDGFAVINIGAKGSRKLKLDQSEISLSTAVIVNPRAEVAYLVLGVGI